MLVELPVEMLDAEMLVDMLHAEMLVGMLDEMLVEMLVACCVLRCS